MIERYEALDFSGALQKLWAAISELNQRIVARAPWELAKDEARRAELDTFLYGLLEAIRLIAVLTFPTMPGASLRVLSMVGGSSSEPTTGDLRFGRLASGSALGEAQSPLPSDRVGRQARARKTARRTAKETLWRRRRPPASDDRIDIADFAKVRLRIAKVIAAERIPKSRKLLKLQVDLGSEQRQVVAGMAGAYEPESLVGRLVVVRRQPQAGPTDGRGVEWHGAGGGGRRASGPARARGGGSHRARRSDERSGRPGRLKSPAGLLAGNRARGSRRGGLQLAGTGCRARSRRTRGRRRARVHPHAALVRRPGHRASPRRGLSPLGGRRGGGPLRLGSPGG